MAKRGLIELVCAVLEAELDAVLDSARAAHEGATHEDSRAENQYDTRGLEQSYLAGAQVARAAALEQSLLSLRAMPAESLAAHARVALGALIDVDNGSKRERFLLAPDGGGIKVETDDGLVVVITPQSPLGVALLGKTAGDVVEFRIRGRLREYEILRVA